MHRKPAPFYRHLIAEAARFAWRRKSLWVFGLFAGLLSTGGVLDITLRHFNRIERMGWAADQWIQGILPAWDSARLFQFSKNFLDPLHGRFLFGVMAVLIIAAIYLSLRSQSMLVTAVSNEYFNLKELWKKSRRHVPSLLLLNLLWKLAQLILLLLAVLPFTLFLLQNSLENALLYFGLFLILFPLAIIANTILNLAVVEAAAGGEGAFHALHAALSLFKKHWLASLELSLITFLCSLIGWSLLLLAAALFLIPSTILVTTALLTGLPFLFSFATGFCLMAYFLGFVLFFGLMVVFQYATWVLFFERATHRVLGKRVFGKMERLWQSAF